MNRTTLGGIGALAGIVAIIGAVGSWATYQGAHLNGTDANRGITVAVAAGVGLLLMLLYAARGFRWASALAIVAGAVAFGLTIWSLAKLNSFAGVPSSIHLGKGWGIWLALIGSLVLLLAALAATFMRPAAATVATPEAPPPAT
jgi:hypothetical protein